MNILDKTNKSMAPVFVSNITVPKREKFSWAAPCSPGQFMEIDKNFLNIDGSYQREQVSKTKVLDIARDWDWKLFGTLSVIRRKDGTFWVYEGGHRTRASFYRDDITVLPCMVFDVDDDEKEAKAFIGSNTLVNNVTAYDKHRASVKAGEPTAMVVQHIIEKTGYIPSNKGNRRFNFSAINTLRSMVVQNVDLAEKVFATCALIAVDGENISGEVLEALFVCQSKLSGKADILINGHLDRLSKEGLKGIEIAIRRKKHLVGKGGGLIGAIAILELLNKGKHRRLAF